MQRVILGQRLNAKRIENTRLLYKRDQCKWRWNCLMDVWIGSVAVRGMNPKGACIFDSGTSSHAGLAQKERCSMRGWNVA